MEILTIPTILKLSANNMKSSSKKKAKKNGEFGFSLFEVVIVICLISIIFLSITIGVPKILNSFKTRNFAMLVKKKINAAIKLSSITGKNYLLSVNKKTILIWNDIDFNNEYINEKKKNKDFFILKEIKIPDDIFLKLDKNEICLNDYEESKIEIANNKMGIKYTLVINGFYGESDFE